MKLRPLAALTPLRMPRKPLIIPLLLLIGVGVLFGGGYSNHAWAAEADGQIVKIMRDDATTGPGRTFIVLSLPPSSMSGGCEYAGWGLELNTGSENYKEFLALALATYTSGKQVKASYTPDRGRCHVLSLWLQ